MVEWPEQSRLSIVGACGECLLYSGAFGEDIVQLDGSFRGQGQRRLLQGREMLNESLESGLRILLLNSLFIYESGISVQCVLHQYPVSELRLPVYPIVNPDHDCKSHLVRKGLRYG